MNRNIYGTIHVNMQMFDVDFPMVQLTLAKAMHETTIHSSVSCQKITFYEADQMDKSLRCKIKSEWEEREEVKKNTEERMFVNKIAIVVKFHAAVKTESTCVCCFYRNLRVIGFFYFLLIFLLYLIGFFSVLVTANTFFIELRYIITYSLLIEFISKKKPQKPIIQHL